jgi:hypothetical protein
MDRVITFSGRSILAAAIAEIGGSELIFVGTIFLGYLFRCPYLVLLMAVGYCKC